MKPIINLFASILFIIIIMVSCTDDGQNSSANEEKPSNEKVAEKDMISLFYVIESHLPCDIKVQYGENQKVEFLGNEKGIDHIELKVNKGKAIFRTTDNKVDFSNNEVLITSPGLQAIFQHGSSNIQVEGKTLNRNDVTIVSKGSGNVDVTEFNQDKITILNNGSGDISIGGSTDLVKAYSKGSGNTILQNLIGKEATVDSKGSGDVYVHAAESLNCNLRGSGNVYLTGDAQVDESIKGSGDLIRK